MSAATKYAALHRKFLQEHNPKMYRALQKSGELEEYIRGIGEEAEARYETLETQMMTSPHLPTEPMARLSALRAIPVTVDELVLEDLIFQPLPGST